MCGARQNQPGEQGMLRTCLHAALVADMIQDEGNVRELGVARGNPWHLYPIALLLAELGKAGGCDCKREDMSMDHLPLGG